MAAKRLAEAAALVLILRLVYKRLQDSEVRRVQRFHKRFGPPKHGCFVVTGASSGIGLALATELSQTYGYDIIVIARREPLLSRLASELPTNVIPLACDLQTAFRDEAGVLDFRKRLEGALPAGKALAGCLHMAGNSDLAVHGLTDKTAARNLEMLDLNCRATLGVLQAVVPLLAHHVMRTDYRAVAVTPGALTAFVPSAPTFATSAANKNYIRALTLSLRYEYESDGIDFVCACPVAVRSEILDNADSGSGIERLVYIPTGLEWAQGVLADLSLGLPETNGRYMDYMTAWMKFGWGWTTRYFFQGRVQSNSVLLNRPVRLEPLREKLAGVYRQATSRPVD